VSDTTGSGQDHIYTNRTEAKYIVSRNELNRVIDEVESRMKPFYPKKGTEYVINQSQYLDTDDLEFAKAHLSKADPRYKVRVRSYSPDGESSPDNKYLEVKYKEGDTQKKERVQIDEVSLLTIMGGKALPATVRQNNLNIPKNDFSVFEKLINKLSKDGLAPIVSTKYKRLCYKSSDCRITIDQNLQCTPYAISKKYNPDDLGGELKAELAKFDNKFSPSGSIIVEAKFDIEDEEPKWVTNLLDDAKADDSGFSKYMWALSQVLL